LLKSRVLRVQISPAAPSYIFVEKVSIGLVASIVLTWCWCVSVFHSSLQLLNFVS